MTELEIRENRFYVLRVKTERGVEATLHNDMNSPISKIKDHLKSGVDPENIELMTIEMKGEKFEIKSVPWSVIAVGLVKD